MNKFDGDYHYESGETGHGMIHETGNGEYVNDFGDPVYVDRQTSKSIPDKPEKSIFADLFSEISKDVNQEMHGYKTIYRNSGIITSILFGTFFRIMFLVFKYAIIYWPLTISFFLIGFGCRSVYTMLNIQGNFMLNGGLGDLITAVEDTTLGIVILFIYYLYRKNKYK